MRNNYVVKKIVKNEEGCSIELFLNPSCGFCVEMWNGGAYLFRSKTEAKKQLARYNRNEGWKKKTIQDKVLTYEEYIQERDLKLDSFEKLLQKKEYETHRENKELYVYLSEIRFGKMIAMWEQITLYSKEYLKKRFDCESEDTKDES